MASPVRYPSGVTNVTSGNPLGQYGLPDPTKWHTFFDDFDYYLASDWTITAIGTGTTALTNIDGGGLLITNSALDNDGRQHRKLGESFQLTVGKRFIYKARFKLSDVILSDFLIGLASADTTLLGAVAGDGVTDGVFFQKDSGVGTLDVYVQKDTTTGQAAANAITTLVNDTFVTVALYYNGKDAVSYYVDDVQRGTLAATSATLPDAQLTVVFAQLNGEAVAKTSTIDYIFAANER